MAEQQAERRVFLVKPGDTVVFSNVQDMDPDVIHQAGLALREILGADRVVFFAGDVDMDVLDG